MMSFPLSARYSFPAVTDITPAFLMSHNIKLLMMDLDNTVAPYHIPVPSDAVIDWCEGLKASGITPYFVSNSKKPGRVERFAEIMGIGFITRAGKPSSASVRSLLKRLEIPAECAAIVGDQIFTDILCAGVSGISGILVRPITFKPYSVPNILRFLRYCAETPFRIISNLNMRRKL